MVDAFEQKDSISIFYKGATAMKLFTNWKTALVTLVIFAFSMGFLPGFTAMAMAADTATPSDTGAGAAGDDTAGAAGAEGAGAAGASGGEAVFAGLSAGTIAAGVVVVAAGIAIIAASSSGSSSSTSHH
jgi:hypothetical protein